MKMSDLLENTGRIVKGVNTTVDVGVDQTSIEAAKFGNTVDKDGRPPTLSTKVKGKSTNVLFNLGLAEGYKLQLERDKKMLVLNITNTKTGHRTEVRGKPGYESGNHDPDDELHQLLDALGKSANFAELINGEVVTINPKHPDAEKAKQATDKAFSEMELACMEGGLSVDDLDKPTPSAKELAKMHDVPLRHILKQLEIGIEAEYEHTSDFEVAKEIALDHIAEDPNYYDHLKFIEGWSDKYKRSINCSNPKGFSQKAHCAGRKKSEDMEENFADGKVKGKSRPGRVKRSGASCNGSVTDLRKRAKNASGEKAKMYHWCANMKSGRKKK
jgi:hypothetical protein